MKRKNYIDATELFDEYLKSKERGQCTERLGELFMLLTDHMLRSARFVGYPSQIKEDLRGHAFVKLIKSIDTVNLKFTPRQIFNFATRTIFTAYVTELMKHYKQEGIKREATRRYLENAPFIDARIREEMISEIDAFESELMEKKKNTRERKLKKENS